MGSRILQAIGRARMRLKFANLKLKTLNDTSFRFNKKKVSDTSFGRLTFDFIVLVDRIGNFKRMNVELQTFKFSKVKS
jgi:hypothetical protein